LRESDLSVAEVACACGYLNAGHFTAAFLKNFATTPGAYRRAGQGEDERVE
ncbi:MAG: AraC family transcriptional regulator, partial [Bryobacteraceae bacterium]|nr:AraC family transcriptional regulator [Bryobacteraceae bacterium]